MIEKPIVWIGSSLHDLRDFPDEARRKVGFELRAVQRGEEPSDFKPLSTIGPGVHEIRIRTGDAFRVFYLTKFDEVCLCTPRVPKKNVKDGQARHRDWPAAL